jgi:hypothetical protein
MVAQWLLRIEVLRLDSELDANAGWRILASIISGSHLLVRAPNAHRHVDADSSGLLSRFLARQLLLHMQMNIDEEGRQREIILGDDEL